MASTNAYEFTGRENDGTGLYYYRERYYSPTLQRFITEDPIEFSAGDTNLYAYVGNDPVSVVDPSGLYAEWDDAAFIVGGAAAGLAGQAFGDFIAGRRSCWTDSVGTAFGGAVGGIGLLYGGPVAAGAAGGFAGNAVTQFLNNAAGYQSGLDTGALAFNTGMGFLGMFGSLAHPGVTPGRNSYNAIFKQMKTKFGKGTISKLRPQTAVKMFAGRAADAGLLPSSIVDSAIDQVDNAASMNGRGCGCQ